MKRLIRGMHQTKVLARRNLLGERVLPAAVNILAQQFVVTPFSCLDPRQAAWRQRRRFWNSFGFDSTAGRGPELLGFSKMARRDFPSRAGTGEFDPVLCELAYRWFCPIGGLVLDPFAGGSVRGIVAAALGYRYIGVDVRVEQVRENRRQAKQLGLDPIWHVGDARNFAKVVGSIKGDFVFSSPPYFNRECYSDLSQDLNNSADYRGFLTGYFQAIGSVLSCLKRNRFCCFEVANSRDNSGFILPIVKDTIVGFERAGTMFYNEGIHIKPLGSASIRTEQMFLSGRKLCPTHEHVVVFVNGDWRRAVAVCNRGVVRAGGSKNVFGVERPC